jgi:hypothetical protein
MRFSLEKMLPKLIEDQGLRMDLCNKIKKLKARVEGKIKKTGTKKENVAWNTMKRSFRRAGLEIMYDCKAATCVMWVRRETLFALGPVKKSEGSSAKPPGKKASKPPGTKASKPPRAGTKASKPPCTKASKPPCTKASKPPGKKASAKPSKNVSQAPQVDMMTDNIKDHGAQCCGIQECSRHS